MISLSRILKNGPDPFYKVAAFEMDEVAEPGGQRRQSSDFSKDEGGAGFVSPWDLPSIEEEGKPEKEQQEEDFNARLSRLEREAYENGFEQGQKDGLSLEKRKIEEIRRQIEEVIVSLRDLKPKIYSEAEGDLIKLVMLIARKILGEEIRQNSAVIGNTIKSAMQFLTDKSKVRIILNPDDMEEVNKLLPDMSAIAKGGRFELAEDAAIHKGGCILETGFGRINACIEDQLSNLEEELEKQYLSTPGKKK
jgi:flagellar assembly protein FliH